jgi:hypothetical protein
MPEKVVAIIVSLSTAWSNAWRMFRLWAKTPSGFRRS